MSLNSVTFILLFLPIFVVVYAWLSRSARLGLMGLLTGSVVFYSLAGGWYILVLLTQATLTYVLARVLLIANNVPRRRLGLLLGLLNLAPLIAIKYLPLLFENRHLTQVPGFLSWWGGGGALIPLGISFFSFNLVSYVIDVYQARIEPARSIIEFASYATFFPSITSGPLVRYGQFGPGHGEQGSPSWENTGWGLQRFAIGLAKKALVADQIAVFINPLLAQYQGLSPMDAWLVMLGFHFQIYYDFSGYSDMAIGVARLLGISLPENFDSPYVSSSISEFWRRWHMTLSFWFRDYLFMPLSRGLLRLWSGRFRQAARPLGLTVTMLLIGLWHGAAWTYALFGLYQGLLLAVEPQVGRLFRGKVPRLIARGGTTLLLMAGWVLFRSQSFEMATSLLQRMLGIKGGALPSMVLQSPQGFWFIFLLLALLVVTNLPVDDRVLLTRNTAWAALVMAILLLLGILSLDKPIPFLYYQF